MDEDRAETAATEEDERGVDPDRPEIAVRGILVAESAPDGEETDLIMGESSRTEKTSNPADLIAGAIQAEEKAAWFYTTMAQLTSDGHARDTLSRLADDEKQHARTLSNIYVEITGHAVIESPSAAPEGEPNFFDFPSVSRRAALEFALRNEVKAADLYESQAAVSDDPSRTEIFNRLAETEHKHAAYIRSQLRWLTGLSEH
jgi:rubrerythrin